MTKTLADHAEEWQIERGKTVPSMTDKAWRKMYEEWVEWSFRDMKTSDL